MIYIKLFRKGKKFLKLEVSGHSGYDVLGRDILCAAVSSLTQSIIIGLENVISKDFYYELDDSRAYVYIDISCYDISNIEKAQILLRTFKYTMDSLIVDYKKYISMKIEEE